MTKFSILGFTAKPVRRYFRLASSCSILISHICVICFWNDRLFVNTPWNTNLLKIKQSICIDFLLLFNSFLQGWFSLLIRYQDSSAINVPWQFQQVILCWRGHYARGHIDVTKCILSSSLILGNKQAYCVCHFFHYNQYCI